jgi:hypothetical protein
MMMNLWDQWPLDNCFWEELRISGLVLKSSALKTLEEELQAYDLLELDASDKSRSQKKKERKKKELDASGEELDYVIDLVVENVILEW